MSSRPGTGAIGIVDYDAGNMASVSNALRMAGVNFEISADPARLDACRGIILPGVGAAPGAMAALDRRGLTSFIRGTKKPLLGICLGMQLLFDKSAEGDIACIGAIRGDILRFDDTAQKVPHMGWNSAEIRRADPLLDGIEDGAYFYYANSFYAPVGQATIASSRESIDFTAVARQNNFRGAQFHPEKSGAAGLKLLLNFEALCS